jgi:hypothetical protein
MITGPTNCTTSGVCVPGAAWFEVERLFPVPFAWANTLENAPEPISATKTPTRQKTAAIKTRRLKNADLEVDFFFMDEVKLFPSAVKPRWVIRILGEKEELCQSLFFTSA